MNRFFILVFLVMASRLCLAQAPPPSDPQALTLAARAMAALTNGVSVPGVTLMANANVIAGSDNFTGTATLQTTGPNNSRVDLNLDGSTHSEIRTTSGGVPTGSWIDPSGTVHAYALHNCWTDASWFFPALSSLSLSAGSGEVFKYVGSEQLNGLTVQHLQSYIYLAGQGADVATFIQRISITDFYLDDATFLPVAVRFNIHPDTDASPNIPVGILFSEYQAVNGIEVPFHIQKFIQGTLYLDIVATNAQFSTQIESTASSTR